MAAVSDRRIRLRHKDARVWIGGAGDCLLLLHGSGGGAVAHWSGVWQELAERFFVVVPELPGIADANESVLPSYGAYVLWLEELLDALGLAPAFVLGNSFGAGLAWRLAGQAPQRCRGLVMVNGLPPQRVPRILGTLIRRTPLRRLLRLYVRRHFGGARALAAAFPDRARVPPEIAATLAAPDPQRLDAMLDLLFSGEQPVPVPALPSLVLWGAEDRLPRNDQSAGRALAAALGGCEFALLPGAGHLPQLDAPEAFTATLARFIAAHSGPAPSAA